MAELLVRTHSPDAEGNLLRITPESAHWQHVGFEVYLLRPGESLSRETGEREVCITLLGGRANVATERERWQAVGARMSVFDEQPPHAIYVPSGDGYRMEAITELEFAVSSARGRGSHPARLIRPEDVGVEHRGTGSNRRRVHNILPESQPADSLLVVEVYTPEGNWSSYPPHKHDTDDLPYQSYLEETYYHRISPTQGYAFQRVYTDDGTLDETMAVHDGDLVMVPRGYHPVATPPGYDLYYLNTMAGPVRTWKFHNEPSHQWLLEREGK